MAVDYKHYHLLITKLPVPYVFTQNLGLDHNSAYPFFEEIYND